MPSKRLLDDSERLPDGRRLHSEPSEAQTLAARTLDLQQLVGNAAVTRLIARAPHAKEAPEKQDASHGTAYTLNIPDMGTLEVTSYSFGVSNPGSAGAGETKEKAMPREVRFTRKTDDSSPLLARYAADGKSLGKVELVVTRDGEEAFRIVITDARVASFETSGGAEPTEQFSLDGTKVEMKMAPRDEP